jgi:hypothetical protein
MRARPPRPTPRPIPSLVLLPDLEGGVELAVGVADVVDFAGVLESVAVDMIEAGVLNVELGSYTHDVSE